MAGSGIRSASLPEPDQSGVRSALAGSPGASGILPASTGALPSGLAAATAAAAPPAAQVRACPHRDVRVTAQERKESRAAPSRSLAISTAGTQAIISTDPPPPSATTRTSSRTQVPSREVRAKPASSQATVDASATAPPQPVQPADQGPTAQEIFDRLSGPVDPDIEAHVRRTLSRGQMYTPQQWR